MKLPWILVGLALALSSPAAAKNYGRQVRFAGVHPVPKGDGGGMCHIEAPHVHIYKPNKLEYRVVADNNVFIGDPVAYGWDGEKHAYKGHHPVQVNVVAGIGQPTTHYCYITGPHYHSFEPAEGPEFQVVGDAYFYVGEPAPLYLEARPTYIGINATYEPIVYTRPVVTVEPPSLWIGVRPGFMIVEPAVVVDTHPGRHLGHHKGGVVVGGGAVVTGGVSVSVPMPSVSVGVHIGGPAVMIGGGGHVRGGGGKFKHKKRKGRH
jgi:hypothetical protein